MTPVGSRNVGASRRALDRVWPESDLLEVLSSRDTRTSPKPSHRRNGYRDAADGDMGEIRPVVWVSAS
jgi:hypothetical protein